MLGSGALDTGIGVVFVFLLVSLLVTTCNELLAAMLRSRAKWLEYGVGQLIGSAWARQLVRQALRALFDDAGNGIEKFKQHIEVWFKHAMDRVVGWYKRRSQRVTAAISLVVVVVVVVVVAMNVDATLIVRYLDAHPAATAAGPQAADRLGEQSAPGGQRHVPRRSQHSGAVRRYAGPPARLARHGGGGDARRAVPVRHAQQDHVSPLRRHGAGRNAKSPEVVQAPIGPGQSAKQANDNVALTRSARR